MKRVKQIDKELETNIQKIEYSIRKDKPKKVVDNFNNEEHISTVESISRVVSKDKILIKDLKGLKIFSNENLIVKKNANFKEIKSTLKLEKNERNFFITKKDKIHSLIKNNKNNLNVESELSELVGKIKEMYEDDLIKNKSQIKQSCDKKKIFKNKVKKKSKEKYDIIKEEQIEKINTENDSCLIF
jgi:hypothetical protein